MISSFENFRSSFVEEALDNIDELEETLLAIEKSPEDPELLGKVFRGMHSLKGGGAMFGFDEVSNFAHQLENLYDSVRAGSVAVTPFMLSLTFRSIDLLRKVLQQDCDSSPGIKENLKQLSEEIFSLTSVIGEYSFENHEVKCDSDSGEGTICTWFIQFVPGEDVLTNGTNILYLIDELKSLGHLLAYPRFSEVPLFHEYNPEKAYVFWDLFLVTDQGRNAIMDVFLFVELDSEIHIHALNESDLFQDSGFRNHLREINASNGAFVLSDFVEYTETTKAAAEPSLERGEHDLAEAGNYNDRSLNSIRVSSAKIDDLMDLVSEMVINQERLNHVADNLLNPELKMVSENFQKLTTMLRDSTFSMSLVPLESLVTRFQRLVRDVGKQLDKQIEFSVKGSDTELDKSVIDRLADPLLHIIRNAVDHGIESPQVRSNAGKPEKGHICLEAEYVGANVVIRVKDDGAGIDPLKIREKAIEKNIISKDQTLSEQEILDLVFVPGFTTNDEVTDLSGRGVGMDVVKRNIEAVRGQPHLYSEVGSGTTVEITLPLVLSIIDGLLVQIDHNKYVLPLTIVEKVFSVESKKLKNSFLEVATLDSQQIPFVDLRNELNIEATPPEKVQVVLVKQSEDFLALSVDKVVGNIQAVLKPLGVHFRDQKMISAATIMGDGSIGLVIDVGFLFSRHFSQTK